ncbi:MAG: hypothetical protein KBB33_01720 [Candidatus Cloacimonetes bacterium]|nr:hypothetical protein [Candidatus Cloacimonadota bacterium]
MKNVLMLVILVITASMLFATRSLDFTATAEYSVTDAYTLVDIGDTFDAYYFQPGTTGYQIVRKRYLAEEAPVQSETIFTQTLSQTQSGEYQWSTGERLYDKLWIYVCYSKVLLVIRIDEGGITSYSNFAAANHSYDDLAISISLRQFGQGQILYSEADKLYRWNTTAGSCSAIFTLPYETIYATLVKLGEEYLLLCAYPTTVDTHPYLINSSYAVQQTNLTNHLAHSCVKLDDDLYWVQRQRLENSTSYNGSGTYRISGTSISSEVWWEEDMYYGGYEEERPVLFFTDDLVLCAHMSLYGAGPIAYNFVVKERGAGDSYSNYSDFPGCTHIQGEQIQALWFQDKALLMQKSSSGGNSIINLYSPDLDNSTWIDVNLPYAQFPAGYPLLFDGGDYLWLLLQKDGSDESLYAFKDANASSSQDSHGVPELQISSQPNPFVSSVQISARTEQCGAGSLTIYNCRGQVIREYHGVSAPKGEMNCIWDGKDAGGRIMPSGIYQLKLTIAGKSSIRKITKL